MSSSPPVGGEPRAGDSTQRQEGGTEKGKEFRQIRLCYFTVLPKAGTGGAHRCPTSTTTDEVCKSCLEKGKLTSEIQDSLESMISLVESKFSLAFKKCYTLNALVAGSNYSPKETAQHIKVHMFSRSKIESFHLPGEANSPIFVNGNRHKKPQITFDYTFQSFFSTPILYFWSCSFHSFTIPSFSPMFHLNLS